MPHVLKSAGAQSATFTITSEAEDFNFLRRSDFEALPAGRLRDLMLQTFPWTGSNNPPSFYEALAEEGFSASIVALGVGIAAAGLYPIPSTPLPETLSSAYVSYENVPLGGRGILRISVDYSASK
jgi:hypothetical protein